MNITILHKMCGNALGVFLINNRTDMRKLVDGLKKTKCRCGRYASDIVVAVIKEDAEEAASAGSTWDTPPSVRHPRSYLKSFKSRHVKLAGRKIDTLGAYTDEYIERQVREVIELCPPDVRRNLSLIPVRYLGTYEPNAVCITFKGCTIPAIALHSGLVSFLLYMNQSAVPLIRFQTLDSYYSNDAQRILRSSVDQEKLKLQAVKTALYFLGLTDAPKVAEIERNYESLCYILTTLMIKFLLAHEYAHAALDHHASVNRAKWRGKDYFYECSRRMETAADEWAQDVISGAHATPEDLGSLDELRFAAPILAFLYFDFLSAIRAQVAGREPDVPHLGASPNKGVNSISARSAATRQTHPADRTRAKALMKYIEKHGSWQAGQWISVVDELLDGTLHESRLILEKLGLKGVQTTSHKRDRLVHSSEYSQAYADTMEKIYSDKLLDEQAQERLEKASKAIDDGEGGQARQLLEEILRSARSDFRRVQALFGLAHVSFNLEHDVESSLRYIDLAMEVVRSDEVEPQFQALSALATMVSDELPESRSADRIRLYELGCTCDNPMVSGLAHSKLGFILGRQGRLSEAKVKLEKAHSIGHEFSAGEAAANLAAALVANSDRRSNRRAVNLALEAISTAGSGGATASATLNLGLAYMNLSKHHEAEAALLEASECGDREVRNRALKELRTLRRDR